MLGRSNMLTHTRSTGGLLGWARLCMDWRADRQGWGITHN